MPQKSSPEKFIHRPLPLQSRRRRAAIGDVWKRQLSRPGHWQTRGGINHRQVVARGRIRIHRQPSGRIDLRQIRIDRPLREHTATLRIALQHLAKDQTERAANHRALGRLLFFASEHTANGTAQCNRRGIGITRVGPGLRVGASARKEQLAEGIKEILRRQMRH